MQAKVFIVVDDPIMGNLLEVRLAEAGFDARYLETAGEALTAVGAADPADGPILLAAPEIADESFLKGLTKAGRETPPPVILLPAADGEAAVPPDSVDEALPVIPLPAPFSMDTLLEYLGEIAPEETDASAATGQPSAEDEPAPAGALAGVSGLLASFHHRGVTGLLEVRDLPEKTGVFLDGGEIVHAHYGDAEGKKALFRIIRTPDGAPQFHPQPRLATETRSIRDGFQELMAEAGREADTLRRVKREVFDSALSVDEEALARSPEVREHRGLSHILTLVADHRRMRRVLDRSRMTDRQTYTNLVYLLKTGVVKARSGERIGLRIVTDSTADLPDGAADGETLLVAPISVRLGGKTYRDGLDIGPRRFYDLLRRAKDFPETEPPSPEDFYPIFEGAVGDADLLGIFLSRKLSETVTHARTAVDRYGDAYRIRRRNRRGGGDDPRIAVVDSQAVSLGLGLLAAAAAEEAREGKSLDEVRAYVEGLIPALRIFFAVDSLAYLQRSGRLGRGRAVVGSMLGLRPILGVRHGEVIHVDQVRGEKGIPAALADWIAWSLDDPAAPLRLGVMHADAPDRAERLAAALESRFDCRRTTISQIGPVVGAHCGPGTVGAAVLPA